MHPSRPTWTAEENALLRQHYSTATKEELTALLPRRNPQGVRQQAVRLHLTHVRPAPSAWSDEHMAILREHYPTKGAAYVAKLVGRTPSRVTGHAHDHLIKFTGVRNPARKTPRQYPAKKAVGRPRKEAAAPTLPAPKAAPSVPLPTPPPPRHHPSSARPPLPF